MKIEEVKLFRPIQITLENVEEAKALRNVIIRTYQSGYFDGKDRCVLNIEEVIAGKLGLQPYCK